jgi:hypothetical protein
MPQPEKPLRTRPLHFEAGLQARCSCDFEAPDTHAISGFDRTTRGKASKVPIEIGCENKLPTEIDTYMVFPEIMLLTVLKSSAATERSFVRKTSTKPSKKYTGHVRRWQRIADKLLKENELIWKCMHIPIR